LRLKFDWKSAKLVKSFDNKRLVDVATKAGTGTTKDGDKISAGFRVLAITKHYDPFARAMKKYATVYAADRQEDNRARKSKNR
jgi:thymidine phosphorylase